MKKISLIISGLALIATSFSCQRVDIDSNTEITGKPLKVTAYIDGNIETRMSYDTTYNSILPHWEDGDEVFGFDSNGNTFTFTVTRSGENEAELSVPSTYEPAEETKVYAIFAPGYSVDSLSDNSLSVNLASQGGVLNPDANGIPFPALMCATGEVVASGENNEIELHFTNQTAIIGVKKFQLNGSTQAQTVTSMTINGVITTGTFQVNEGVLELVPGTETGSITASNPDGWTTEESGICTTSVYFAAMPTNATPNITLSASDGTNTYLNVSDVNATAIEPGKYYYMSKRLNTPVASVNGVEFGSLSLAIDEANSYNGSESTATISLLDNITHNSQIDFNNVNGKAITLDLNGYTLSTSVAQFITSTGSALLSIKDSRTIKGKITSSEKNILYLTTESAKVELDGCIIESTDESSTQAVDAAVYTKYEGQGTMPELTISNGARVYTNNTVSVLYCYNGKYHLNNCEITSGKENGTGRYCIYLSTFAIVYINKGASLYSTGNSSTSVALYSGTGNSSSRAIINGGHFYGHYAINAGNASYSSPININGGYFNTDIHSTTLENATINGTIISSSETHTHHTTGSQLNYTFTIKSVAKVNGTEYGTLSQAVAAANAYDGSDATVTLTLLEDAHSSETILLTNSSNKPIVLDLNNHTLTNSSSNNYLIRTNNGFTLTVKDGNIVSNDTRAIYAYQGTIYLDNCSVSGACEGLVYNYQGTLYIKNGTKIKGVLDLFTGEYIYNTGIVRNYLGTMSINDSFIEATGEVTALLNSGGTMSVSNSEVSASTDGTHINGCAMSNANSIVSGTTYQASLTILSGSYYTNSDNTARPAIYNVSNGTISINGGYFYNANSASTSKCIRSSTNATFVNITVNGGFFSKKLSYTVSSTTYNPTYGSGKVLENITSDPETHTHITTGQTYSYNYKVVDSTVTP